MTNAVAVFLPLITALNTMTPTGIRWEVTETPDAAPDGATSLEAYTLRKVIADDVPRENWTGSDFTDDIIETLLHTLNEHHSRAATYWYSSGLDDDVHDPDQPETIAHIEFWRLHDTEAYKAELLDEEMPEPGHIALTVEFDFEETRVYDVTTRIIVPEEIRDDRHAVRRFLRDNMDWYDELDRADFSAPDDDREDVISNVRIVKRETAQ
ncbi:hypothetical protein [Nonomuraea candida]|uniref:hypothetical protein n=1 Tax=Nonomuraea candida TaxID=359159 RepID=UPI0005BB51EF|nr:hypothetical protein [Nonomuraea candida]